MIGDELADTFLFLTRRRKVIPWLRFRNRRKMIPWLRFRNRRRRIVRKTLPGWAGKRDLARFKYLLTPRPGGMTGDRR